MTTKDLHDNFHFQLLTNNANETELSDEEKFVHHQNQIQLTSISTHKTQEDAKPDKKEFNTYGSIFIAPQASDYVDCKSTDHKGTDCAILKRIIFLLKYYDKQQKLKNYSTTSSAIYEYISSLPNYDVPAFMEDWYQCKKNHLTNTNDMHLVINSLVNCDSLKNCNYIGRYIRERSRQKEIMDKLISISETPHKDIILRDQFDSMHTFIFHST
eukprot:225323_1